MRADMEFVKNFQLLILKSFIYCSKTYYHYVYGPIIDSNLGPFNVSDTFTVYMRVD